MAEQEKKPRRLYTEEEWRAAITSWIAEESDMDFDEFETPLRADLADKLLEILKSHTEN